MRKNTFIGFYLVIVCLLAISCKKEIGTIGWNVQPNDELLNTTFFDTATLEAYSTLHNDSIATNAVMYNMLGYINDPIFGLTQAGFYAQGRLQSFNANFGEGAEADSLILSLAYTLPYGDTLNPFQIRVYELNEDLVYGQTYYANTQLKYNSEDLIDGNGWIYPTPSVRNDTSSSFPVLHIPLKKSFANNKFISKSGGVEYQSMSSFLNYFKGLYVVAEAKQNDGSIVSINLTNNSSSLTMYYHNHESTNKQFRLVFSDSSVRVGYINHNDYKEAETALQEQLQGNYTSVNEKLYLQTGIGIKTLISFPYLKQQFEGKKIIVHRAELVVTRCDESDTTKHKFPTSLFINYYDTSKGYLVTVPDYSIGANYFDGKYNKSKGEYRIRITKHLQYLIDGTSSANAINLIIGAAATNMSRTTFYGLNPSLHPEKRLRLEMYYSEIQNY